MFSDVSRMAAAKPARPAPITITPVFLSCDGADSDGGESTEICEDALIGGLRVRGLRGDERER